MNSIPDPFEMYARALIKAGHDRHWIRRNEPALRRRFAENDAVFLPAELPEAGARDRYEEI